MGEFIVKKWQCDRCERIEDKRPRHAATRSLIAEVEYDFAGSAVRWKELCKDCNSWLGEQFKAIGLKL